MDTDLHLLERYHRDGDTTAFQKLVSAHAGMVFSAAQRITQDAALAEEVAQDTFLALARRAETVRTSVAAWLHHVARQKACNALRGEKRRHHHEQEAASVLPVQGEASEAGWREIEPVLDEALQELPEAAQRLLIEHFLEQRGQRDLASRMGVSQSTVSRQLESALQLLRDVLRQKGVVSGTGLAGLLGVHLEQTSIPDTLTASLGKLAMTGIRFAGVVRTSVPILLSVMSTTKIVTLTTASVVVAARLLFVWLEKTPVHSPTPLADAPVKAPALIAGQQLVAMKPRRTKATPDVPTLDQLFEEAYALPDDRALMLAEFQRMGGTIKEDFVDADITQIIRQHFGGSRSAFEESLRSKGLTFDQFRVQRREDMIIEVLKGRATRGITSAQEKQDAVESWLEQLRRKSVKP
jgi:RNA polymerase sigma factor (sigma-70 family)